MLWVIQIYTTEYRHVKNNYYIFVSFLVRYVLLGRVHSVRAKNNLYGDNYLTWLIDKGFQGFKYILVLIRLFLNISSVVKDSLLVNNNTVQVRVRFAHRGFRTAAEKVKLYKNHFCYQTENLTLFIWGLLRNLLPKSLIHRVF